MKKQIAAILILAAFSAAAAHSQSNGEYQIESSVIAGGGGTSSGNEYQLTGTIGQTAAGTISSGGTYRVFGGFWHPEFAPTAAHISLSGKVLTNNGRPIAQAWVTLTDANGATRRVISNGFGYFRFDSVEVGQVYLFSATHRQHLFVTRAVLVNDEMTGLDLTALP